MSEAQDHIDKARQSLAEARILLAHQLNEASGRASYIAVYHAAQAYILLLTNETAKTHEGVHTKFHFLAKDDNRIDPEMRRLIARTYRLKALADYETGASSHVPFEVAEDAFSKAEIFVQLIDKILLSVSGQ